MNGGDFLDLITSPVMNMDSVVRYSGTHSSRPENVSNHTCQVGLLAFMIGSKLNILGCQVNLEKLALKCLVHDLDESLTGDVSRGVKYYSPELRDELAMVASDSLLKLEQVLGIPGLQQLWINAKNDGVEGFLLNIADTLQVVKKILEEVVTLGNRSFLRMAIEVQGYLQKFRVKTREVDLNEEATDYLVSLIDSALDVVEQIETDNEEAIRILRTRNYAFDSHKNY